jgi:hypothetical protein
VEIEPVVYFDREQRRLWRSGQLPRTWRREYPAIFDPDDLRLALSQPDYGFYEALVAVHLFEARGYLSLLPKYECPSAGYKREKLRRICDEHVINFMENAEGTQKQPPDLLVYEPDESDWCFCEVKGPGDRLRPEQEAYFDQLRQLTGKPLHVVHVVERRGLTAA